MPSDTATTHLSHHKRVLHKGSDQITGKFTQLLIKTTGEINLITHMHIISELSSYKFGHFSISIYVKAIRYEVRVVRSLSWLI